MGAVSDVQTYLAAQGLVDGATGWKSVRRRKVDDQDQIVVLTDDGGPAPEIKTTDGIGDNATGDAGVQCIVRGPPWDGDASFAKAEALRDELHGKLATSIGGTTYLRVMALSREPIFMGFDDVGRPEHSIAFRLMAGIT